ARPRPRRRGAPVRALTGRGDRARLPRDAIQLRDRQQRRRGPSVEEDGLLDRRDDSAGLSASGPRVRRRVRHVQTAGAPGGDRVKNEPHASSTIGDLSQRLRAHDVSAVDIVDACLARIDALNPRLNAFITVLADGARERAQEADRDIRAGNWRGPLHGVPVGIKDFYDTAGVRTTAAFERFKDRVPKQDAFAVTALQDAGAIVIGKTNMHRLGMGTTGLE